MVYRRLAFLICRYPWFIMVCWAFIIAMSAVWALRLPDVVQDHGLKVVGGEGERVQRALKQEFGMPMDPVIVVFDKNAHTPHAEFVEWIKQHIERMRALPDVKSVISPFELGGNRMFQEHMAVVFLDYGDLPARQMKAPLAELRSVMKQDAHGTISLTGKKVVQQDVNALSFRDLEHAEWFGLPLALLVLCYAFRGLRAACLAVSMGIAAVVVAMGALALLGHCMELSNFVINVIPMVGMALSLDFALILLGRLREEWRGDRGQGQTDMEQMMQQTLRTAGRAVLFSAACVLLGLIGLLWIRLPMFASVALGAIAALIVSVLLNFTLLPAIACLYARHMFGSKRGVIVPDKTASKSAWQRWSGYVMKHPVRMALLGSGALLLCVLPVRHMELSVPDAASLPASAESRIAAERLQQSFSDPDVSVIDILIGAREERLTAADWRAAAELVQRLSRDHGVVEVESAWGKSAVDFPEYMTGKPGVASSREVSAEQRKTWLRSHASTHAIRMSAVIRGAPGSTEATDWIERMKTTDAQAIPANVNVLYGGEAVYQAEIMQQVKAGLPKVLVFVVVSNYIVLLAAFRSLLIPIKAILMNLLSLAASFGILAVVFNQGHFGIEATPIAIMIPAFIAGLVFGISMDYGVFMLSRIQEAYRLTGNSDLAVQRGLASSGRLITSAATILLAVTIPFAFGDVSGVKQLGVGITAAVIIDVTVIRLILVPALMKLMGRWNWWLPGRIPGR